MKLRRAGIGALTVLVVTGAVACGSNNGDTSAAPAAPPGSATGSTGTVSRSADSLVTGTTAAPTTTAASTDTTASNPDAPSASSSSVPAGSPSTTAAGSPVTTKAGAASVSLPSGQSIPPGTSAEDKAWCAQAKPVSAALLTLFSLNLQQFQQLVDQANSLLPTAPAAVKPPLTFLHDIGARFLTAVQAGQAQITENGIIAWATKNLTQAQQTDFLNDAGSVTNYINQTC